MASSTSRLVEARSNFTLEEQAAIARNLIRANELYNISNSMNYSADERSQALAESTILAKQVLKATPRNSAALNLVARIELDNSKHNDAESLLLKALELAPDDETVNLNYGYVLLAKREYDQAEIQFNKVLNINKSSVKAFSGIALTKLRNKDYLSAFGHYKMLLELGVENPAIQNYFVESSEYISCDTFKEDLEMVCLKAFSWTDADHAKLAHLSSSLIEHKYNLRDPEAILDLQNLVSDELLLESLAKTLLPNIYVEDLIVELRKCFLEEVAITQTLRDEILPFAIALGQYAARTDYALMQTREEELQIAALVNQVTQSARGNWANEDLAGALIVISMYEPLYTLPFSTQLLRDDLEQWPIAIQPLLRANLYDLCTEHQISYDLFGSTSDSVLSDEVNRASERWSALSVLSKSNIQTALSRELGEDKVPARFATEESNLLIVGCESGKRAFHLAQYFENVNVVAVDSSRENIAYARLMSQRLKVDNVHFVHADYDTALIGEEHFDIIEFGDAINHVKSPANTIKEWTSLLAKDGLVRFSFNTKRYQEKVGVIVQLIKERRLSPTADNIRHLRNAILKEATSGLWDDVLEKTQFFSGAGFKDVFFNKYNHYYNVGDADSLLDEIDFGFLGFVDLAPDVAHKIKSIESNSLKSWQSVDQDDTLFGDSIEMYCTRA